MPKNMIIVIDYDETYTEDQEFWDCVIALAQYRGHKVICATMRYKHEGEDVIRNLEEKVHKIVFTERKAKARYLSEMGYESLIFIDDSPHWLLNDSR